MIREPRFPYDPSFFRFVSFEKLYQNIQCINMSNSFQNLCQNIQYKNKINTQKQKGRIKRKPWFPFIN
jgi:hypothetical protein